MVLDLLDAVIGDKRFGEIKDEIVNIKKEGRKVDMCEFLDKIENRGVEKGRLEGKIEGKLEGKLEGRLEGKAETQQMMLQIFPLLRANVPLPEISKRTGCTMEYLLQLQAVMQ